MELGETATLTTGGYCQDQIPLPGCARLSAMAVASLNLRLRNGAVKRVRLLAEQVFHLLAVGSELCKSTSTDDVPMSFEKAERVRPCELIHALECLSIEH